jgi:hypothetical protein
MSTVPPELDQALEFMSQARSDPHNLRLFDALHFLREALRAGAECTSELGILARVHLARPDPQTARVLAALDYSVEPPSVDPLEALIRAAGLPPAMTEPIPALEEWLGRQKTIIRVQQERLEHAERILSRANQATQLATAIVVVLLGVVALLLLVEGDWLEVPAPVRTAPEQPEVTDPVEQQPGGQR